MIEEVNDINEKSIILKITQKFINTRGTIYEASRHEWRLNLKRAEKADYVFSVLNGIIVEIFSDLIWIKDETGRITFEGKPASDNMLRKYKGKYAPSKYVKTGSKNPCRYINIPEK